jgi:hypothetical protein
VFWFVVRLDDQGLAILYFLRDHVAEKPAMPKWPFSPVHEHWLYDEIDSVAGGDGHFVHNVLLSTGIVLSIPFSGVLLKSFEVAPTERKKRPRHTA